MLRGGICIIVQHHPTAILFPKRWRCRVVSQCDDITVGQKLLEPQNADGWRKPMGIWVIFED
jgi:hypothetical protein